VVENRLPHDDDQIRDYLLGKLESDSELAERIDEQILSDANFAEAMDMVEDEIIDEYLEDTLSKADRNAVEEHFLRPPERQRKLRSAQILQDHVHHLARANKGHGNRPTPGMAWFPGRPRLALEIVACILLIASAAYIRNLRSVRDRENSAAQQQLATERGRSDKLIEQLREARELISPLVVTLMLTNPGTVRGDNPMPQLKLGPDTNTVFVNVLLGSTGAGSYDARLEHNGTTLWSQDKLLAFTSLQTRVLLIDVPARNLVSGECSLVLIQNGQRQARYPFVVSKLQKFPSRP